MKIVVDMNLTPDWIIVFRNHGWESLHWSSIGAANAKDRVIMAWARPNGYVVFTHDLDFGAILAVTQADGPSVIQVRAQDVLPIHLEKIVTETIRQYETMLNVGALIVVDEARARVRILPLIR